MRSFNYDRKPFKCATIPPDRNSMRFFTRFKLLSFYYNNNKKLSNCRLFLNFMAREGNSSKNNKNCYITRGPEIVFEFVRKKLWPAERVVRGFRLSFVFMLCIKPFINQTFHSSIIAQRERVCLLFPLKTSIKSHSIAFLY